MKSTPYMKGLLYAESERQRLEGKGCNDREIYLHMTNVFYEEANEPEHDVGWILGFDDYRNAYLKEAACRLMDKTLDARKE